MPIKLCKAAVDHVARRVGYVPKVEMDNAIKAKELIERQLRHKSRDLEHTIMLRDELKRQLGCLEAVVLAHAAKDSGTQRAVEKLDHITTNLMMMMRDGWPHQGSDSDVSLDTVLETITG